MTAVGQYRLTGVAHPENPMSMLDEICEHFVEHADVERTGRRAVLKSRIGTTRFDALDDRILIEIESPSDSALQMSRTTIAEHLFYFARRERFGLDWSGPKPAGTLSNLHHVTVTSTEDITPRMRRVKLRCDNVAPFIGGAMHVRLLVPPVGREPVWPTLREDGRVHWPSGEDALLVRAYTIRSIDPETKEMSIDFLQHPAPGIATPGADFARDAVPGMQLALMGPGSGSLPVAGSIFLAGDESALPAIARIAAEVPAGTRLRTLIEVADAAEEQPLPSAGEIDVRWIHRDADPDGASTFADRIISEIESLPQDTFVWVACEKADIRAVRRFLKQRGQDRRSMYVAWYWQRDAAYSEED